jgi:hypothetical protein
MIEGIPLFVSDATFSNISVISWQSVFNVEQTWVHSEKELESHHVLSIK